MIKGAFMESLRPIVIKSSLAPVSSRSCLKPLGAEEGLRPIDVDEKQIYTDKPFCMGNYRLKR